MVEAKAALQDARRRPQQAKDYAEILGLKFAYATNGHGIIEFDYIDRHWNAKLADVPRARRTVAAAQRGRAACRTRPPSSC